MDEFSKQAGAVTTNRSSLSGSLGASKVVILNEFVAATGYARKYAIRRLNHPGVPHLKIERPRVPRFGPEVQEALHLCAGYLYHPSAR